MKKKRLLGIILAVSMLTSLILPLIIVHAASEKPKKVFMFEYIDNARTFPERGTHQLDYDEKTEGSSSISATKDTETNFQLFWVIRDGEQFDVTKYDYLTFDIWIEDVAKVNAFSARFGSGNGVDGSVYDYPSVGLLTTGWNSITMPIAGFREEVPSMNDRTKITRFRIDIVFKDNSAYTIKMDNMWLTDVAATHMVWDFDQEVEHNRPVGHTSRTLDTEEKIQGKSSEQVVTQQDVNFYWLEGIQVANVAIYDYVTFDFWIDDPSKVEKLALRFGENVIDQWEYVYSGPLKAGWNLVKMPVDDFQKMITHTNEKNNINVMRLQIDAVDGQEITYRLDNFVLTNVPRPMPQKTNDKMLWNFDSLSINEISGDSKNVVIDGENKTEGQGSASITARGTWAAYYIYAIGSQDLTQHYYISYDIWLENASRVKGLKFRFGTDTVDDMEYVYRGALEDGWNKIAMPISGFAHEVNNHDIKNITRMRVSLDLDSATDFVYKLDNLILTNYPDKSAEPLEVWNFDQKKASITVGDSKSGSPTQNFDDTKFTEGNGSIALTCEGDRTLFYFLVGIGPKFNVNQYSYLTFGLYLEDASRISGLLIRYGINNSVDGAEATYRGTLHDGWNHVAVPLSSFAVTDAPQYYNPPETDCFRVALNVTAGDAVTLNLDNMWLTNDANAKPNEEEAPDPEEEELVKTQILSFDELKPFVIPRNDKDAVVTQEIDTVDCQEGAGSTKIVLNDTKWLHYWMENIGLVNLTDQKYIEFDIYLSDVSKITELHLRYGSNVVDGAEYKWQKQLSNGWNHLKMPIEDFVEQIPESNNPAAITKMRITVVFSESVTNYTVRLDDLCMSKVYVEEEDEELQSVILWSFDSIRANNKPVDEANGAIPQSIDSEEKTQGDGSTKAEIQSGTDWMAYWLEDIGYNDFTEYKYWEFDLNFENAAKIKKVYFRVGSGSVDGAEYVWSKPLVDGWNAFKVPIAAFIKVPDGPQGAYNMKNIDKIRITLEFTEEISDMTILFDNMRLSFVPTPKPPPVDHGDKEHLGTMIWAFDEYHGLNRPIAFSNVEKVASHSLDYEDKTEGEASTAVMMDDNSSWLYYWLEGIDKIDLTAYETLEFDFWIEKASLVSYVTFRFGSVEIDGAEYIFREKLNNGWNHVSLPIAEFKEQIAEFNTPSSVGRMRIGLPMASNPAGYSFKFDNLQAMYWGYPESREEETEALVESDSLDIDITAGTVYLKKVFTVGEFLDEVEAVSGYSYNLLYNNKALTDRDAEIPDGSSLVVYQNGAAVKTYSIRYYNTVINGGEESSGLIDDNGGDGKGGGEGKSNDPDNVKTSDDFPVFAPMLFIGSLLLFGALCLKKFRFRA